MVNEIIEGISIKLNSVFGDGYEIHTGKVEQGLKEPCFFIKILNPEQTQMLGTRNFRMNSFDVHYFGNDPLTIAEQLFSELEFITLVNSDLIHGTDMRYEVIDDVLHFFINYNLFTKKIKVPEYSMETLLVNTKG